MEVAGESPHSYLVIYLIVIAALILVGFILIKNSCKQKRKLRKEGKIKEKISEGRDNELIEEEPVEGNEYEIGTAS